MCVCFSYHLAGRWGVIGRMRGRDRCAAVDQQRQEERVEGGHGSARQGGESRSQQVQTHECRRVIEQQGGGRWKSPPRRYLCAETQRSFFFLLQLTDAFVLRSTFLCFPLQDWFCCVGVCMWGGDRRSSRFRNEKQQRLVFCPVTHLW